MKRIMLWLLGVPLALALLTGYDLRAQRNEKGVRIVQSSPDFVDLAVVDERERLL